VKAAHPTSRRPSARPPARWADPLLWLRVALALSIVLFLPGLLDPFEGPKAAVVRTLGLGALAAWLVSAPARRRLRWQPLDLAVAGWLGVEFLGTVRSVAPRLSFLGESGQHEGLLTSLGLAGLYLAARWCPPDPRRVRTTLQVAIAAAAAASAYALIQTLGLDPVVWTLTAVYDTGRTFTRPFGPLGHPNLLGVVSAAALAASLPLLLLDQRRRWLLALAAGLLGAVTLLTLSRAAWLGVAAGVFVGAVLQGLAHRADRAAGAAPPERRPARRRTVLFAAAATTAVVLAVLAVAGGALVARFAELLAPGGGSGRSRLEIWKTALACWRARPWLGHGPDTFALVFPRFQTPEYWRFEWATMPIHAHSIYLHTLATRGVLGVAAGAALAAALLAAARTAWGTSPDARRLVAPLLAAIAAIAVAGAFGALGLGGATFLVAISAALASLAERDTPARPRRAPAVPGPRARMLGAATAALAIFWAGGDLLASRAGLAARMERPHLADPASASRAIAAANRAVAIRPQDDALAQLRSEVFFFLALASTEPRPALAEAEVSARRAIELAPLRAANHQALGNVLSLRARLGDPAGLAEAESVWARCFELAPCNALAMLQFVRGELALQRPQAALPLAQRAARLYPQAALAQVMLAQTRLALGDRAAAREALERALAGQWYGEESGRALTRSMLDSLGSARAASQESRRR
jgi:O-antigen ligase